MSQPIGTFGNGGLVDIVGPSAPPPDQWGLLAMAAVILLVLVAGSVWFYRRHQSPRRRALRHVIRLQRQLRQGAIAPRSAAFELAAALGRGSATRTLPEDTAGDAPFAEQLRLARFGRDDPSTDTLLSLLTEAHRQLERGPA